MLVKKLCFLADGLAGFARSGILLCLLAFVSCGMGGDNPARLATVQDPPLGRLAEPGPNSGGIMLGHYNTCRAYANYVTHQLSVIGGLSTGSAFGSQQVPMGLALNFDQPVLCQNAHTCHCLNSVYFIEDFRGQRPPVYRCVEPSSARREQPAVYHSGKPGQGVIKFALPRSVCQNQW